MGCLYSKKNKITIIDTNISNNNDTYIEIRSIYIQSDLQYRINFYSDESNNIVINNTEYNTKQSNSTEYNIDFCIICDLFNPNTNLNHHCNKCNKCHYKYKIYCKLCNNCYNPLSEYDIIMHRKKFCI